MRKGGVEVSVIMHQAGGGGYKNAQNNCCALSIPPLLCINNQRVIQPAAGLLRARRARSGPKGPARGPEGPARASVARPLYLKLLTRHTIKPGTRQTKMPHIRQTIAYD